MSSHTSSGDEFPFQLVSTESSTGNLNVFSPLTHLVTGGMRRVSWVGASDQGQALLSFAADVPIEPSGRPTPAFLQALNRCFPSAFAGEEPEVSLGVFTQTGQCVLEPTSLRDGHSQPEQQRLIPGLQWQQDAQGRWLFGETVSHRHDLGDHTEANLQLVRWIPLDARVLLNEHQDLLVLHEVQKISLWRAGHNLLTPFNSVFGMLEMVLLGLAPADSARDEWAARLNLARWYLEETSQDILKIPSVSQHPHKNAVACIQTAVVSAIQMAQHMADERSIQLVAENASGQARIPLAVLTEVFLNLLGNAIKYSPEGHGVEVSTRQDHGFIDVCVVNDLVPGRTFQVPDLEGSLRHMAARPHAGHGVGLATCVFLIRRHGGSIQQEHPQGQQCKTTIRLLAA